MVFKRQRSILRIHGIHQIHDHFENCFIKILFVLQVAVRYILTMLIRIFRKNYGIIRFRIISFTAFPCLILAKPLSCLFILLMSQLRHKLGHK